MNMEARSMLVALLEAGGWGEGRRDAGLAEWNAAAAFVVV